MKPMMDDDGDEMVMPNADSLRLARANKKQKVVTMAQATSHNALHKKHMKHVNRQMKAMGFVPESTPMGDDVMGN